MTAGFVRPILQSSFKKISDWDPYLLVKDRKTALNALNVIDKHRLGKCKYIVDDELSIADICAYEEMIQMREWNFIFKDAKIETEKQFPNIYAWMDRMKELDGHDDTHRVMTKLTPWVMDRYKEYESLYSRVSDLMSS